MKRQLIVIVGWASVVGLGACSDTRLPPNLLLTCDSDADCPADLVCEPASGRCVPALAGAALQVTASVNRGLVGGPLVGSAVTMTLSFNEAPGNTPTARLVSGLASLDSVDAVAAADGIFTADYVLTGTEPDGIYRVEVEAIDARGLPQRFVTDAAVTIDFTPPAPVAVSVQRFPDPRRTPVAFEILDEVLVGPAIDVRVVFSPNEPVFLDGSAEQAEADPAHVVVVGDAAAPAVQTDVEGNLTFVRDTSSANPLIFDLDWDAGGIDGPHALLARITDLAGNTSTITLDIPGDVIDVDTVPPARPAVDVAEAVVFERAPWGRLDAPERDVYRLVGNSGAVEENGRLLVSRDAAGRVELGRAVADDLGAFIAPNPDPQDPGSVGFPTGDLATVFLRVADAAGNVSEAVAVRDVRWLVTPLDKVPGDTVRNPHRFDDLSIFTRQLGRGGAVERGAADGLQATDDAPLTTVGAGSWRRVPQDDPQSLAPIAFGLLNRGSVNSSLATDPVHGVTMLFGGTNMGNANGPAGFVNEGACTQQTADVYLRGTDDRWRRRITNVLEPTPATSLPSGLTFVPPLGQLVLLLHRGETWTFDGSRWQQLCAADACVDVNSSMQDVVTGLTWDARRQVLVAALGTQLFEYAPLDETPVWRLTSAAGDFSQGLSYSQRLGVVSLSGTVFNTWDGTTMTTLCTDAACAATAPPGRTGAAFAYDRVHDNFVFFGGDADVRCDYNAAAAIAGSGGIAPQPSPPPTDTFTFDGTSWTAQAPSSSPPGRAGHAMAWDELRQRVVLVGGDECNCLGSTTGAGLRNMQPGLPNDTWEWDGATWTPVGRPRSAAGFTRQNPPPLRDHAMVEAPLQGGVLMLNDGARTLRMFDGDAWFSTTNSTGFIGERMAMVAASPAGDIVGFGGGSNIGSFLGTADNDPNIFPVRITGTALSPACTGNTAQVPQCSFPPAKRRFGATAFHDGERFWMFGGSDRLEVQPGAREVAADNATDELWSWSPSEGWQQHCTGGECGTVPSARILHRGAVADDGTFVVFGGLTGGTATTNETWRFDGETWSLVESAESPPAREGHAMAFDAARGVVVVAYGTDVGGIAFREPREFDPGTSLDPRVISDDLSEVWELSGTTWRRAPHGDPEGDGRPSPRYSVVAAGLPQGGVALMGGTPSPAVTYGDFADFIEATPRSDESWVWDGGANARPAHRFELNTQRDVSLLDDDDVITGLEVTWRARGGRTDGETVVAVELLWWDGDGWRTFDDGDLVDCGAGCLRAVLGAEEARLALQAPGGAVSVAVAPRQTSGTGPGRVTLASDAVEVGLRWQRP